MPHLLSKANQEQARAFIFRKARPLERSLYAYCFEGAPRDTVLAELAKFQNADGGFGHGLESDLRRPDSSALATTEALQILRKIGATSADALVQGAMRYLLATYDAGRGLWPIIPSHPDNAPRAPWWNYSDALADQSRANPTAEIVGYLYEYADLVPADFRSRLTGSALQHLAESADRLVMHDAMCYVRFAETRTLPDSLRALLVERLTPILMRLVEQDPAEWHKYVLQPMGIIDGPTSLFAELFAHAMPLNLDYVIARQQADGSWVPNWTWDNHYPEAWLQAKDDWSGVLTLQRLRVLHAYQRFA